MLTVGSTFTGVGGADLGFEQAGWRVTPSEPKEVGAWRLPGRLVVEGHGVKLKIVIDEWRVGV